MNLRNWLTNLFQIRRGEEKPILLLTLLSYFTGWGLALYYITSTTVFLEHFDTEMLPLAYAVAGVVGYLAWYVLSFLDRRATIMQQLTIKTGLVLLSMLFFSFGNQYLQSDAMAFAMFVWFRVLAFISVVVFWGVAGRLFNLQQGKRIFGLISTGEVISDIIGFLSIPLLLRYIGYTELLFLATLSIACCLVVLLYIQREFKDKLVEEKKQVVISNSKKKGRPFLSYLKEPYFRNIFVLAMIPIFALMFIDFMFLDQTKTGFSDPEVLAHFLSLFFGAVAVIELLLKTFLSGRIISKYGLKAGLVSLPVALFFSTLLGVLSGAIYGPTLLFFSFIILSKLTDRSVRSAIYDPSFQILYQPLPMDERIDFQNKIEGIPKAIGNAVAGLALLGLTVLGLENLVYFNLIFLFITGIWVVFTLNLYKEYRAIIRKVLMGKSNMDYTMRSFVKAGSVFFEDLINSPVRRKAISTLNLMEKLEPITRENYYKKMLQHPNARLRIEVLDRIAQHHLTSMELDIHGLLAEEENEKVKVNAEKALDHLGRCKQLKREQLLTMVDSKRSSERQLVADILGQAPGMQSGHLFIPLLQDDDPHVRTAALLSLGKVGNPEMWPYLLDNLSNPVYSNAASTAIIEIGESILPELDILFGKMESNPEAQYKIIRIIGRIGGKRAIWVLKSRINHPVDNIRHQVLLSLSNLGYKAKSSESTSVKQAIEYNIGNVSWALAGMQDLTGIAHCEILMGALNDEVSEKMERVFLLLSLLYDSQAMKKIRDIIRKGSRDEKVFAVEIIDMLVEESIRDKLTPLVEENSLTDKLKSLRHEFPQEQMDLDHRLRDIVNKDFITVSKWTRSCALELIGRAEVHGLKPLLIAHFQHPDFVVRQTAQFSMFRLSKEELYSFADRLVTEKRVLFLKEIDEGVALCEEEPLRLVFNKVAFLKELDIFYGFPEIFLVELAELSSYVELQPGEPIAKDENANEMFKVVFGSIKSQVGAAKPKVFKEGQIISEMDFGTADWKSMNLDAESPTGFLRIPQEPMFEAIGNHIFLARFIASYIDNK